MLPTVISRENELGIKSFLRTSFPPASPTFERTLDDFLDSPGTVFKGPYYTLRLPFRPAPKGPLPFQKIQFPFRPHLHQARAFSRLCSDAPRSTLIATGTGSGKTECFLYPILDACASRAGTPGIKAIIIYPMNALATDQAKRFASAIYNDPTLRGKVTAGLFIGGEGDQASAMTADWLITSKHHMRENPPDILLTNYKMLDYLLVRPQEQPLWQGNGPETLRYLVVDELHTFDGAQATDLTCLIRRLKARLRTPKDLLCCVGTSATLGSSGSVGPLVQYARTIFAEPFTDDSVIGEDLLSLGDVVEGCFIRYHSVPDVLPELGPDEQKVPEAYLAAQFRHWFSGGKTPEFTTPGGQGKLGQMLREHSFFRNLLTLAERSGRKVLSEDWLIHELSQMVGEASDPIHARRLLDGFLSLCCQARFTDAEGGAPVPLLRVHVHNWIRELSRLVASVGVAPKLAFSDDLKGDALKTHLPVLHCRECGAMGWGGTMRANAEKVGTDLGEFYKAFFGHQPSLRFFFPIPESDGIGPVHEEFTHALCGICLGVNAEASKKCACCGNTDHLIRVLVHNRTRRRDDKTEADIACPFCESGTGLTIVGYRAATLTSVALSQMYTSPFNNNKQALAFSDNVQDASHRSGFFGARTYRVNLRTAIAKVIGASGEAISMKELETRFLTHWKTTLGELDFIGLFLAPNMEWLADYEMLKNEGRLPAGSNLAALVARRCAWEMVAELGFNSRIGRTLEKTGTAIAFVPPQRITQVADELVKRLREKSGGFGSVSHDEAVTLIHGIIHRLRTGGGIFHPELDDYIARGGDSFTLDKQVHMPAFGKFGRGPSFFYVGLGRLHRFEKLVAGGTSLSWSQRRVLKTLRSIPNLSADSAAIVLEDAARALVEAGILEERTAQEHRVWGLPPSAIEVTCDVRLMRCNRCGHSVSVAAIEETQWVSAPCLRTACAGEYGPQPRIQDYFGDLYRAGDVIRIRSAEHTSLLTREQREWVEKRFMARPPERRSTDPNLLSCTPTLEMGVNIGDLSSVILCTVPPATANYVQRIGRAGRKEGAAVSLTIASAQPHDLYYFELPEDMITGDIRPPGTFLDAPAVLERQFSAFCLDRWSEQNTPKPVLPKKLSALLDAVRDPENNPGFPYDFFRLIESNLDSLLSAFLALFEADELALESRMAIENFARGNGGSDGGMTHKILKRLTGLAEDREDLRWRIKKVGSAIQKNRKTIARDEALDAELEELKKQRDGIHEMSKQINAKLTLNFFTDEGLLPNYAFPEEGVELRSVILRKREELNTDGRKYDAVTYEYVRPAASAITEFAPGSVFYAGGRRMKVDQIGLRVSPIETWRFCDACGHMEALGGTQQGRSTCPVCDSANWADSSLKRDLVRLRQVVSTSMDSRSRSHDDQDQREKQFFSRHESIVIPADAEREAYQVKGASIPFGFEFLGKVTLRVVNLGQDTPEAQSFRLGGREVSSGGFVLCPECGKVQGRQSARGEEELTHDLTCRQRGKDTEALKAVFLYRELHSEAIRVLLPSSSADESAEMTSFVAALHLGLRIHFGGSIDHIKGCVDERPIPGTSLRRKYLVLYDQVPGGTGYLKQLSHKPEMFLSVLAKAMKHLRDCECATRNEHEADGCHRCIMQSRHSRDHGGLSRTTAIRLLETILQHADQLERVDKVSDIDIHPLIQSELEKQFLESLRLVPDAHLQSKIVRGKPGFLWRCGDAAWDVALQVNVPVGGGIDTPSIPDFVLYPVRNELSRPVAIFLDGFAFHADEAAGNNRIALDVQQRQALTKSGKFWVWSFSWEDIRHRNDPSKIQITLLGEAHASNRQTLAQQILTGDDRAFVSSAAGLTSWSLFMEFLRRPAQVKWRYLSYLYALTLTKQLQRVQMAAATEMIGKFAKTVSIPNLAESKEGDGFGAVFSEIQITGIALTTADGIRERDPNGVFQIIRFDDDSKLSELDFVNHWRGFLRLLNRVQFLPNLHLTTIRGCLSGGFSGIVDEVLYFLAGGGPRAAQAPAKQPDDMADDFEMAHPAIIGLLKEIMAKQLPQPELGFELLENGMIAATAEAVWPVASISIIGPDLPDDCETFRRAGWQVFEFTSEGMTDLLIAQVVAALSSNSHE